MEKKPSEQKELEQIIDLLSDRKLARVAAAIGLVPSELYGFVNQNGLGVKDQTILPKLKQYLSARCLRG
jgi:hypothetical protein